MIDYRKFQGKHIEEVARYRKDLSSYCRNCYEDEEGDLIYAQSDDDNYTDYMEITITNGRMKYGNTFAESFTSRGDIMEVFPEFL